jgi:hypothetical protein
MGEGQAQGPAPGRRKYTRDGTQVNPVIPPDESGLELAIAVSFKTPAINRSSLPSSGFWLAVLVTRLQALCKLAPAAARSGPHVALECRRTIHRLEQAAAREEARPRQSAKKGEVWA